MTPWGRIGREHTSHREGRGTHLTRYTGGRSAARAQGRATHHVSGHRAQARYSHGGAQCGARVRRRRSRRAPPPRMAVLCVGAQAQAHSAGEWAQRPTMGATCHHTGREERPRATGEEGRRRPRAQGHRGEGTGHSLTLWSRVNVLTQGNATHKGEGSEQGNRNAGARARATDPHHHPPRTNVQGTHLATLTLAATARTEGSG